MFSKYLKKIKKVQFFFFSLLASFSRVYKIDAAFPHLFNFLFPPFYRTSKGGAFRTPLFL